MPNNGPPSSYCARALLTTILVAAFWPSLLLSDALADEVQYGQHWDSTNNARVLQDFCSWTKSYAAETNLTKKAKITSQGLQLAKDRRIVFRELITTQPARAIAATIPVSVLKQLPPEIQNELETVVSGIGNFSVLIACSETQCGGNTPHRQLNLNGKTYRAFVYGRRLTQSTQYEIPLHGVALDGDIAVHEKVFDEVEKGDVTNRVVANDEVVSKARGKISRFAPHTEFDRAEATFEKAESMPGQYGNTIANDLTPKTSQTVGQKNVLWIRVDFPDLPGEPKDASGNLYTKVGVQEILETRDGPFFLRSSYGKANFSFTVTPQLYRLPKTALYYATQDPLSVNPGVVNRIGLHKDALTAATVDYDTNQFDLVVVHYGWFGPILGPQTFAGGSADVGGPRLWEAGGYLYSAGNVHEFGHSFTLHHANLWKVTNGNPISLLGHSVEVGDVFDVMGSAYTTNADFNPWFKYNIGWITDSQIQNVTGNGIYRVHQFDTASPAGILALKIRKDERRSYWVCARRDLFDSASLQNGAYIFWGYTNTYNKQSDLLDMSTPGGDVRDAALPVGRYFSDPDANVVIHPLANGGPSSNQWMDVEILFGPTTPFFSLQPKSVEVAIGRTASFTTEAAGIPTPTYRWQLLSSEAGWLPLNNNASYSGATNSTLSISSATPQLSGGSYRCVVSNNSGVITSTVAVLNVKTSGVVTLAGTVGLTGSIGGPAHSALFHAPAGVAVDRRGDLYIADTWNEVIRKITRTGEVTAFAGVVGTRGSSNGVGNAARFNDPYAIAVSPGEPSYLIVADMYNHTIRKITADGTVSTIAGLAGVQGTNDGVGDQARFRYPQGVAVDNNDVIYVADTLNQTIRKISPTGAVSTWVGTVGMVGYSNAIGTAAIFRYPIGITVNTNNGLVYVADSSNCAIRQIAPNGQVTTLAGTPTIGTNDGLGSSARFYLPRSIALDKAGTIYVADSGNGRVRKVTPAGMVTTLPELAAPTGAGYSNYRDPWGIAVDDFGNVYVSDFNNHTIRMGIYQMSLNIRLDGNDAVISWNDPNAILEHAATIKGPWGPLAGSSPLRIPSAAISKFYRLKK